MGEVLSLEESAKYRQLHDKMSYPDIMILFIEIV